MAKFIGVVIGVIEVIAGIIAIATGFGTALGVMLIIAGAGTLLTGIGTILTANANSNPGFTTAARNPVAPWLIPYGHTIVGGTMVYINEFGDKNKYLDLVIVLAAIPLQSVDAILFDKQRVVVDFSSGSGTSFTPVQQTTNIFNISRTMGVVTVVLHANIPSLVAGDYISVAGAGDYTLDGRWAVAQIISQVIGSPGSITFTYVCGGINSVATNGRVSTLFADYGRKVYVERQLGTQTTTFNGMLSGTPDDGGSGTITNPNNPWDGSHLAKGKTVVMVRLHYDEKVFAGGLPQISFLVHGKKDIYDPRTGTYGYTANAALCIADYLSNQTWGFKATYGTEIPTAQLIAAANTCDELIPLAAGGTEPRYECHGKFDLSMKRGEVLQNLLTCIAGRLSFQAGQFVVQPGAWYGSSPAIAPSTGQMSGAFQWKTTVPIRELFNGVKGVYVSPANGWQNSDIPPYAQDTTHGYSTGPAWSSAINYGAGVTVVYSSIAYVSTATNLNKPPSSNPTFWSKQYQDINMLVDGGDRRWLDIQLPFTISSSAAQRICKIELMRRRHRGTGTFRYNMAGYSMTALDVIEITLPLFGWVNKLLEITAHRFVLDRQSQPSGTEITVLGVEIDVQETDSSVYDWATTEELTPQGYQQPSLPNQYAPAPPTGLTVTSDETTVVITPKGLVDSILVEWNAPLDAYVAAHGRIEVQYMPMLIYAGGKVSVVNNTSTINGVGTAWDPSMEGGDVTVNGLTQQILTVVSATVMTLTAAFGGPTAAAQPYQIQYGDTWIGLPSVNASVTQVNINGVVDGDYYTVQVRSVNAGGYPSPWQPAPPVRASGAFAPLPFRPYAEYYPFAPSQYGMNLVQIPGTSGIQSILIRGTEPVNVLSTVAPPVIDPFGVTSAFPAGSLPVGNGVVQVFGIDAAGKRTAGSNLLQYTVLLTTSKVTFSVLFATGTVGYEIFIGPDAETLFTLGPQTGIATSLNVSQWGVAGYGPPDPTAVKYVARGKRVIHGGIAAATVVTASHGVTPTISIAVPGAFAVDALAGRWLLLVGKYQSPSTQPGTVVQILHNDAGSPTCLLTMAVGSLIDTGDLVLISTKSTSSTINSVYDSGLVSPFATGGLTVNAEVGNRLRVLFDPTGAAVQGDLVKILGNTNIGLVTTPFQVAPGAGTVFIVEEPGWRTGDIVSSVVPNSVAPISLALGTVPLTSIPSTTLSGYVALVELLLQDVYGNNSPETPDGFRMLWVNPTVVASGNYVIAPIASGVATIDLSQGNNQEVQLTAATTVIANPTNIQGINFSIILAQDATGARAVTFDTAYKGVTPGAFDTTKSTATILDFTIKSPTEIFLTSPPHSFQLI